MPNVRASAVLARLRWVRERLGPVAERELVASLGARHAGAIAGVTSPDQWVPFDTFVALCEAIDVRHGRGDLALCREVARYAAEVNLPTLYRLFYKVGSVRFIISKAASLWSAHYDSGEAHAEDVPGGIALLVEGFATPHRAHCTSVLGWMEQSMILSGAKLDAADETRCRTRGDAVCELRVLYH